MSKRELTALKNVILIGMPGSGKSTVGVLLAKTLGYGFVDTDLVIQQREGALLQEALREKGVEGFLDAEAEAIQTVKCEDCVVATGGSAVCRPAAMDHLKRLGTVVYLSLPCHVLEARIRNIKTRGIAMAPGETLQGIYRARTPLYERYADLTVHTSRMTLERSVSAVLRALVDARPGGM